MQTVVLSWGPALARGYFHSASCATRIAVCHINW